MQYQKQGNRHRALGSMLAMALGAMLLAPAAALATHLEGTIICVDNQPEPLPLSGVKVTVSKYNNGTFEGSSETWTDASGHYNFDYRDTVIGWNRDFTVEIEVPAGLSVNSLFAGQCSSAGCTPVSMDEVVPASSSYDFSTAYTGQIGYTTIVNFNLIGCAEEEFPLGACRTTGGGKLFPEHTCPTADFATFGGQVGASLGVATEWDPDSDFIKGEWQHVRHGKGELAANFHARSFDSLLCACFEEGDEPGVVIGELCNPGDRVNGPEPRRAPANKIAFSGVGKISMGHGPKLYDAVFRVDIEDRSEPGGNKPGEEPADRYRIRIWVLDEGVDPDSTDVLDLRMAVAASAANVILTDGDPSDPCQPAFGVEAPTYDDGGILDLGNRQIHPPTGATRKLL